MNKKYKEVRKKYENFIYESYSYKLTQENLTITYKFTIPGLKEFKPTWNFKIINKKSVDKQKLEELIFSLGMTELVSYWKTTCSKTIHINCGYLNNDQINWWKKLYRLGLGEFFYTNNIEPDEDLVTFKINSINKIISKQDIKSGRTSALIPIGGGKDSIVTLELIKDKKDSYPYIINPRKTTLDTVKLAGLSENLITATRTIDRELLILNEQGFLNGHTPFSAIVAFSSLIAAYINDIEDIVLSNEDSANESTVANTNVNHQYSKSYEFETDFDNYEKKYLETDIRYFSFLRPLAEIQIAKVFAKQEKYHHIFKSCNIGSKTDIWCSSCAKCLFVYIILLPFLEEKRLAQIFNKNLLNDKTLLSEFKKLIGEEKEKPFECVGSVKEVQYAMQKYIDQKEQKELPFLANYFYQHITVGKNNINEYDDYWNKNNNLPNEYLEILKGELWKKN